MAKGLIDDILSPAKDNPLSGGETAALVVGGIVVVGVIGGVLYFAMKPAAAATPSASSSSSSSSTPAPAAAAPGSLSPANVAAQPTTALTPGTSYVVIAVLPGVDLAGNVQPGYSMPTQAGVMAAIGQLGWANVSLLYWGPTDTATDPQGFLGLSRIGSVKAWAQSLGGKSGVYAFTSTYTGAATTLPSAGVTAYKIG